MATTIRGERERARASVNIKWFLKILKQGYAIHNATQPL